MIQLLYNSIRHSIVDIHVHEGPIVVDSVTIRRVEQFELTWTVFGGIFQMLPLIITGEFSFICANIKKPVNPSFESR